MKTRSVTGLGCLLVLLSAMACEPDDSARNTGKAGQLLAENRTWSRCNFVEGADCYYANPCTEWVDGDTVIGGHTWQRVYYPKSVIRLAGAFPMAEMVLSGILPASVRILLLATPRRSPLRLRLGQKHAA